jgi:nitrite reductase/ring-hydroxylating ferredoxin subunit
MSESSSRRTFLAQTTCAAVTLALGLPRAILALPVTTTTGTGAGPERTYPIPAGDAVQIDHTAQVIVVRFDNHLFAFSLACPHEQAAVKWVEKDHRFQCTKHDSRYQADGVHTAGRATRNLDRFPVRRDGSNLIVSVDRVFRSDVDPSAWAAASVTAQDMF